MSISVNVKKIMDEAVKNGEVAGCNVLVLQNGKQIAYAQSGYRDVENQVSYSRDTINRLYSMSKPITAVAVMILVDRGLIDLKDPVGKYIDSFNNMWVATPLGREKANRPITIHDLMDMTAGTVYPGAGDEAEKQSAKLFNEAISKLGTDEEISTMELISRMGTNDLAFQPGSTFRYGTCADILGALVEKVSGMLFGDFLKKEIFEPLGMVDTGFYVEEENRERLAKVYTSDNGCAAEEVTNNLDINYKMDKRPAFESGGAGLCSTLDDYAKFATMLINDGSYEGVRILSKRAVGFLISGKLQEWQQGGFNQWQGLEGYSYGNLMRVLYEPEKSCTFGEKGEYGWDGWLGCYFCNDPVNKITILMGMQKINAGTWSMTRKIRNMIFREY
ncbi:MAG: beta-lactamase family protein [Lachnospiraceae bacterium]|nr:beta-lactamase family protein [Lachnospiraceae bacterium]